MRFLFAGFALLLLTPRLAAQQVGDSARVVVSRREARITYPRDTATRWGWAAGEENYAAYDWSMHTEAVDARHSLSFAVDDPDQRGRSFRSLREVLAAGRLLRCENHGMITGCFEPVRGKGVVDDGRVTLVVRDSAVIADLFGLRPKRATLYAGFPGEREGLQLEVDIDYVAPFVPQPSDSLREWARLDRVRILKSHHQVTRFITASRGWSDYRDTTWLTIGDTATFDVEETDCHVDVCGGRFGGPFNPLTKNAVWVVADSAVLEPLPVPAPNDTMPTPRLGRARATPVVLEPIVVMAAEAPPLKRMVARRLGVTTLRVSRLEPYADTASVDVPPPTALSRTVIVRRPVARVVIHPRPDTIRLGQVPYFRADAFDDLGGLLQHAPVEFSYPDHAPNPKPTWSGDQWVNLPPGGPRRIVASFHGKADTITVFVVDSVRH